MAEKKQLYVSLGHQEYKNAKTGLLESQADLLKTLKHLTRLKQIKNEKTKLKQELHQIFSSLLQDLENVEENMPTPNIPKKIRDELNNTENNQLTSLNHKDLEDQENSLDQELFEIKERLAQLKD